MIENGMIVGAESCDPQCQDIECSRCSVCKQWVPDNEITEFFGGDKVCKECIGDYLIKNSAEFEEPFVKEHLPEYVRGWWDQCLDQDERDDMMLKMYYAFRLNPENTDRLKEDRRCFCRSHAEFLNYVEEGLK